VPLYGVPRLSPTGMLTLSQGVQGPYSSTSYEATGTINIDANGNVTVTGVVTYTIWDMFTFEAKDHFYVFKYLGDSFWQKVTFEKEFEIILKKRKK